MEILDLITFLIDKFGYIIVTLAIMLESAGIPMPGETVLVIAAAYAGAGHLSILLVILCAAAGAIVGDGIGYWIGRKLGRPFLNKHGKWLHLTPERMDKLEKLFAKHGPMTVFFGRFFTLLRTYAALFAGVWRMPYATFTLYNALGGIVWALCFGMLGYLFGQNLPALERVARTVGWALTIPVVIIIAFALFWRFTLKHHVVLVQRLKSIVQKSFIGYLGRRYSWHIHWLLRHWTAAQYTVLHIIAGLAIACAGTVFFARTAHSAFSDHLFANLDQLLYQTLQSWATPFATLMFKVISIMGSFGVAALAVFGALYFILRRRWIKAIAVCIVVIGGQLLVFALKFTYANMRTYIDDATIVSGFGFSFPSGHAMESLIVYGLMTYFLILRVKNWGAATASIGLSLFVVLLIGFSRIYLGLNFLSDVICGFLGGIVWLSSCLIALELIRRGQIGDRRRQRRARTKNTLKALTEEATLPEKDGQKK